MIRKIFYAVWKVCKYDRLLDFSKTGWWKWIARPNQTTIRKRSSSSFPKKERPYWFLNLKEMIKTIINLGIHGNFATIMRDDKSKKSINQKAFENSIQKNSAWRKSWWFSRQMGKKLTKTESRKIQTDGHQTKQSSKKKTHNVIFKLLRKSFQIRDYKNSRHIYFWIIFFILPETALKIKLFCKLSFKHFTILILFWRAQEA